MSVLKSKAKSVIAIFICLSLLFGEVMFFPLNSKAETLPIEQSAPLLDVEVDEEEFIIDEGEEGGIRHFPFVFGFGDDIFVSFSQHRDALINHAVDGMRISRDGGATWSTYIEDQDFYLTSLIKLNNGDLFGISYPSYYIDERHASLKYVVSKDNGETWIHSEGTVEFPKDIGKSADSDWASMVPHRSIMQMPDGTLYGTMYGTYAVEGEINYRSIWIKSTDGGANWTVVSDIAVLKGVAGEPQSYCEPTFEVCSDGSILCVLRTASGGDAAYPLYQCRSTDGGLTWSTPEIIPGVTVDDAGCADPYLYMMSNGVLVLSYGRQHCKMLFSGDGTGETWTNFTTTFTETAEKISSCYTGVYEVSPGKLLLVGDKAGANSENQKIWGKYVYVTKHNVAYESGVDAGHVEIDGNTYTAVPYDGNAFLGWYNSKGTLISTNITETFADTDGIVTPKFRNNSIFESSGFEYVELGSTHTKDPSAAVFPNWHTSQDWGSVNIITSEAYDSVRSMRVFSPYRVDLYTDITGLRSNTTYTVSYRWMMPRDYTLENNDCYNGFVASSPEYTSIGDAYKNTIGKSYYARYPEGGVWTKDTFTFNTGDLTTVRLFMDYSSLASSAVAVYIDDFTIYKNPEPLSVRIESGTDAGYITNDGNLYTAVPYDGNMFLGWYNSSGVISTKATEFFADTDGEIIAKFKNNSIFESPSFELNSVGTTYQYHEHSSDKDGWYITATWGWAKTVNNIAHSGSKALQIHGRFQTIYKNIIGLKPNTDYTVSYYWTMPNTYTTANNNVYHGMVAAGNEYTAIGVANSNKLGGTYGVPKYPEAGVWKKDTFTFNTGDLSAVKLFIYYDSSGDALYLDDFTIFETPEPLSVSVESGTDAGYITNEGNVYTAVPYDGNEFLGWYNADGLVSAELTYDFKDLGGAVTAKFKNNSIFESPSFELEALGNITYYQHSAENDGWYISADWGSARIVNNVARSGSKSLALFARYQQAYTNVKGLKPNTDYTVSYYWMMPETYSAANNNVYHGMLACSTDNNSLSDGYKNRIAGTYGTPKNAVGGVWQKDTFTFNTGDLTSVRLFIYYDSNSATLYFDDFTIFKNPEPLSVNIESGVDAGYITNEGNVYTAVPYDGNEFLGWYNADGLVSAELTYDFKDLGGAVIAKFKNNSIFESPSFELNSVGTTYQYHEHSADKEGWYISADWGSARIVNNLAHSGSNSLAVFGRYQLIYTNILGLKPNTNYTVSYYWMMNESYTAENNNTFNGMLVGSTAHNSIGEAYVNALGSTYGGHNVEGGVWQKDTATFNTGDLSSVRLFFEYCSANAALYIDDFTVYEISENLYDYDADLNSGKFVNSGAVNITEVNTNESEAELLGNKVYKMDTSADFTSGYISDTMFLTGGKRYDVSFYFKVADGHSMLTATDAKQYITFFMQKSLTDSANIQLEEAYTVTRNSIDGAKVIYATNTDEFSIDKTQVVDENGATQWQKITASFTPATNTTAVFAIRPNAAGTVYFDQLKVTSAQNAIDEVQSALSVVGTAIRTNGKQALRFKSSIDKTAISKLYFDTYELVEYGSVAIKTSYLGDNELVMGSYTQEDGTEQESHKGAAYIKDDRNIIFADKGSTIHFTAALTGISEENYNTAYSVRTYAVLQRPDGSTFTIYNNETVTATVYDIAVLAYNATGDKDGYAESADVREYLFTNIIDKADFEKFPNDGFKVK